MEAARWESTLATMINTIGNPSVREAPDSAGPSQTAANDCLAAKEATPATSETLADPQDPAITARQTHQPPQTQEQRSADLEDELTRLRAREVAIQRQLDIIRLQRRLSQLEEALARAERGEDPEPLTADAASSSTQRKRRRSEVDDDDQEDDWEDRGKEVVPPEKYEGKNWAEYYQFTSQCVAAWGYKASIARTDADKINYAYMFLSTTLRESWDMRVKDRPTRASGETWESFTAWLREILDCNKSCWIMCEKYKNAKQRPGQTVQEFATYLEWIEKDLPAYSPKHRGAHLLAKLRPELRAAVSLDSTAGETREQILKTAMLHESLNPRCKIVKEKERSKNTWVKTDKTQNSGKDQCSHKDKKGKHARDRDIGKLLRQGTAQSTPATSVNYIPSGPRGAGAAEERKLLICYKCSRSGHIAKECYA